MTIIDPEAQERIMVHKELTAAASRMTTAELDDVRLRLEQGRYTGQSFADPTTDCACFYGSTGLRRGWMMENILIGYKFRLNLLGLDDERRFTNGMGLTYLERFLRYVKPGVTIANDERMAWFHEQLCELIAERSDDPTRLNDL